MLDERPLYLVPNGPLRVEDAEALADFARPGKVRRKTVRAKGGELMAAKGEFSKDRAT
jgi:hypothetical protein